jgi:hypothetical protein
MVSWDTRMLWSSGYRVFSHPETCSGDQSRSSLLATILRNFTFRLCLQILFIGSGMYSANAPRD